MCVLCSEHTIPTPTLTTVACKVFSRALRRVHQLSNPPSFPPTPVLERGLLGSILRRLYRSRTAVKGGDPPSLQVGVCAELCYWRGGVACEERIGRRRYVVDQCMLGTFCWDAIAFDLFSNWHLFSFAFFAMYLVVCLIVSSNVIVSKYELGFISDRNKSDLQNEFCPSFSCCDDVWGHERSLATLRISSSTSCSQRRW